MNKILHHLDFKVMSEFLSFKDNVDLCIVVEHIIYIHRETPGALVQDIKVNNFRVSG